MREEAVPDIFDDNARLIELMIERRRDIHIVAWGQQRCRTWNRRDSRCITAQFDMRGVGAAIAICIHGCPTRSAIETYFCEDIKETPDQVAAGHRANLRLASGSPCRRFAEHEPRTLDVQLEHFGIKRGIVALRADVCDSHCALSGRADWLISVPTIGRDLHIDLRAKLMDLH